MSFIGKFYKISHKSMTECKLYLHCKDTHVKPSFKKGRKSCPNKTPEGDIKWAIQQKMWISYCYHYIYLWLYTLLVSANWIDMDESSLGVRSGYGCGRVGVGVGEGVVVVQTNVTHNIFTIWWRVGCLLTYNATHVTDMISCCHLREANKFFYLLPKIICIQ